METENAQNQEPYFTLPLTSEQYKLLRSWIDAKEYVEVVTDGQDKVMLINSPKLDRKNHPNLAFALGGELIDFRIQLLSPFTDFIEKYLDFFNEPGSLEAFITRAIYEKVWTLHGDLTKFVKARGHQLELQGWLQKFPERVHGDSEEDEENDC